MNVEDVFGDVEHVEVRDDEDCWIAVTVPDDVDEAYRMYENLPFFRDLINKQLTLHEKAMGRTAKYSRFEVLGFLYRISGATYEFEKGEVIA